MEFSESNAGQRLSLNKHGLVVLLLIALMAFMHGCGDSPNGPDTEMIEKTITPTDGSTALSSATLYDDDSGETLGTGATTLKREKGASISVRVEADGFIPTTETVSFQSSESVEITLSSDEVTIDYRIADENDELISSAELFIADTLASAHPEGSITLPYQEAEVAICGRAEYYEDSCEEIALDESRELSLQSARKTVTYRITPEIEGYEDWNENRENGTIPTYVPNNTAYVLQVGDSTWVDAGKEVEAGGIDNTATNPDLGESVTTKVEYPAGPGNTEIYLRARYFPKSGHEYSTSEQNYLNIAEKTTSVTREDQEVNISLPHIPACSDGIDNDFTDGTDQEDPGCMDQEGNYDPQDDVELLHVAGVETRIFVDEKKVSGKDGQREIIFYDNFSDLPSSTQEAISIDVQVRAEVSSSQNGEAFALEFAVGPDENSRNDVNLSGIVEDDGSDGWTTLKVPGVNPDFFSSGTSYEVKATHATKVRGEGSTDGNDDVVFMDENNDKYISTYWTFPPEHVENNQQKQTKVKTTPDNDRTKVRDKQ